MFGFKKIFLRFRVSVTFSLRKKTSNYSLKLKRIKNIVKIPISLYSYLPALVKFSIDTHI